MDQEQVLQFLVHIGLSEKEALVYLTLAEQGSLSVQDIAQATKFPRSTLYSVIDHMIDLGVLEEVLDENKKLVRAIDPERFDDIIAEQKQQLSTLEQLLPNIKNFLQKDANENTTLGTQVKYYKGKEGVKQVVWNTLRAKEYVGYSYLPLSDIFGKAFAQKYRQEVSNRGIYMREIVSDDDPYKDTLILSDAYKKFYSWKYIPHSKLTIRYQMGTYNDVLAIYYWLEGDIFGIEIHNKAIAAMQKQLFELVWSIADMHIV